MQIHILEDVGPELVAIDNAVRRRGLEIGRAQSVERIEQLYMFAGWTLDETTRELLGPTGQRVDLTSSEFDLLMALLRHPGQPLSRAALLGVLRGRQWTYFDRSIDTLVARLRKKLDDGSDRPPLNSLRARRRLCVLRCGGKAWRSRPTAAFSRVAPQDGAERLSRSLTAGTAGSRQARPYAAASPASPSLAPVRLTPR